MKQLKIWKSMYKESVVLSKEIDVKQSRRWAPSKKVMDANLHAPKESNLAYLNYRLRAILSYGIKETIALALRQNPVFYVRNKNYNDNFDILNDVINSQTDYAQKILDIFNIKKIAEKEFEIKLKTKAFKMLTDLHTDMGRDCFGINIDIKGVPALITIQTVYYEDYNPFLGSISFTGPTSREYFDIVPQKKVFINLPQVGSF